MKKSNLRILSYIISLAVAIAIAPTGAMAIAAIPVPAGLWTFDNDTLADSAGRFDWDNAVVTSPELHNPVTSGHVGMVGQAWKIQKYDNLDGTVAGINLGPLPSDMAGTKEITISAWIKREGLEQRTHWVDDWQTVFELHNAVDNKIIFNVKFGDFNDTWSPFAPLLNDNDTGTSGKLSDGSSYNVSEDVFHHVAAVLDLSNASDCKASFYVDGVLWKSYGFDGEYPLDASWFGCSNGFPAGTTLYVGSNKDLKRQFNGLIDEVRVYDKALISEQVNALYNSYRISAITSDGTVSMHTYNRLSQTDASFDLELTDMVFVENLEPSMFIANDLPDGIYVSSVERLSDNKVRLTLGGSASSVVEQDTNFGLQVMSSAVTTNAPASALISIMLKAARKMFVEFTAVPSGNVLHVSGTVENCSNKTQDAQILLGLYSEGQMTAHKILPISGLVESDFQSIDENFDISGLGGYKLCAYVWDSLPVSEGNSGGLILADAVTYDNGYTEGTGDVEITSKLKGEDVGSLLVWKNIEGADVVDYFTEIAPNAEDDYAHSYILFQPVEATQYEAIISIPGERDYKEFTYYTDGYRLGRLRTAKGITDFDEFAGFMLENSDAFGFDFSVTGVFGNLTPRGKTGVWRELQRVIQTISDIPTLVNVFNEISENQRIIDRINAVGSLEEFDEVLREENGRLGLLLNDDYEKNWSDVAEKLNGKTWESSGELTVGFNDAFFGILFTKIDYTNRTLMLEKLQQYGDLLGIPETFFGANAHNYTKHMMGIIYKTAGQIKEQAIASMKMVNDSGADNSGGGNGKPSSSAGGGGVVIHPTEPIHIAEPIITAEQATDPFPDLYTVSWARESVRALAEKGIIKGTESGLFMPDALVTRAEFATMLARAFEIAPAKEEIAVFSDVAADSWYYPYVTAMAQNGIVLGKNDGSFGSNEPITRADMCVIIHRLPCTGEEVTQLTTAFSDEDEIPEYALESVRFAKYKRIVSGVGENRFAPAEFCTRAMAAQIIYNALETWGEF